MHVLIPLAVTIALICGFFGFFTYDYLIAKNVECLKGPTEARYTCGVKDVGPSFIIGVAVLGFLVVLTLGVLYVIARFLTSPEAAGGQPAFSAQH